MAAAALWGADASNDPLCRTRRVLDAAVPLHVQAASWVGAVNRSPPLVPTALAAALSGGGGTAGTIISVSHDDYAVNFGGVQNVVADEQRAFEAAGWRYVHLAPAAPLPTLGVCQPASDYQFSLRVDGKPSGVVNFQDLLASLAALRSKGTKFEIIFHHLKGHVPELLVQLATAVGSRPIAWVHDFF